MQEPRRSRIYLEGATFDMREHVKEHGGRWDTERKKWYVLGEVPELLADLVNPPAANDVDAELPLIGPVTTPVPRRADPPKISTLRAPPLEDAQSDFFVPSIYEVAGKESRSIMDVAVFRLSKKDKRASTVLHYDLSDGYVEVKSGTDGMATVWDYDIVLMAISHLTEAMNRYSSGQGEKPGRTFRPHVSDILKFCRKGSGGKQTDTIISALDRLKSTTIKIGRSSPSRTGRPNRQTVTVQAEGLINSYKVVSYSDNDKVESVEIELPGWIYDEVVELKRPDVLTVHRDYFLIEAGLGRFIYRLARKAAGKTTARWSFDTIYKRSGSTGSTRKFAFSLRAMIEKTTCQNIIWPRKGGRKARSWS